MAVSIVDALVTTLTLDASQYIANAQKQRDALKAMSADERAFVQDVKKYNAEKDREAIAQKRLRDAEERERQRNFRETEKEQDATAKAVEASAKKQSEAFQKVTRNAVMMLGIFTAGKGIKDFVMSLTSGDAATARLSKNIGMNIEDMSRWQAVAAQMGGSAEGVNNTFSSWADDLNNFAITNQSKIIPIFQLLQVSLTDANGKLRDFSAIAQDIASSPSFRAMDRPLQNVFLKNLGIDPGMANAIMDGPVKLAAALKAAPVISKEAGDNAIKFDQNLQKLITTSTSLGRTIFNDLAPQLNNMLGQFDELIKKDGPAIAHDIGDGLKQVATDLMAFPWKEAIHDGEEFAKTANAIAEALGGWTRVSEILFAMWAASKIVSLTQGILGIASALGGVGAFGPVLASLIRLAGPLGVFAATMAPGSAGGTENAALNEARMNQKGLNADGSPMSDVDRAAKLEHEHPLQQPSAFDRFANFIGRGKGRVTDQEVAVYKPLFDLIGKSEGTDKGRGYNETLAYGKWTGGDVDLTHMTLDQIDALQTQMIERQIAAGVDPKKASSALGRYQFTRTTLRDMRNKYQLDGSTPFDAIGQDRLATLRIRMAGKDDPATLAGIWASLPVSNGDTRGAHDQGARVGYSDVQTALQKAHAGMSADPRYTNASSGASSNSQTVQIDNIDIHTQATDAAGISRDIAGALQKNVFVRQANTGVVN